MRDKKQLSPENRAVAVTEHLLKLGLKMFYSKTFGNEVFQKDAVGALDSPINPVTFRMLQQNLPNAWWTRFKPNYQDVRLKESPRIGSLINKTDLEDEK